MRTIHLYVDYGWWPVWENRSDETGVAFQEDFDPHELPISTFLAHKLNDWAIKYTKTLDQKYPPDSGFPTKEEAVAFAKRGIELGRQLQAELGPAFKVIIDFTVEDFENYVQK